jgi:hypothetical protein
MRVNESNKNEQVEETTDAASYWQASQEPLGHKSYHEMSDFPVVEVDALKQLQENIELLSDVQNRLSFLMREVRYLLKA